MQSNQNKARNYSELTDVINFPEEDFKSKLIRYAVEDYVKSGTTGSKKLDNYLKQYRIVSRDQFIYGDHDKIKSTIDTAFSLGDKLIINIFTHSEEAMNQEDLRPYVLLLAAQAEILKDMGSTLDSALITILVEEPEFIQTRHITKEELNNVYKDFLSLLVNYRQINHITL